MQGNSARATAILHKIFGSFNPHDWTYEGLWDEVIFPLQSILQ